MITRCIKYLLLFSLITFSMLFSMAFSEDVEDQGERHGQKQSVFDAIGTIDYYADSEIKIDGRNFMMAGAYAVREFGKEDVIPDNLKKGLLIGYSLDEEKKINAVWIIKQQDKEKAVQILEEQKAKANM